MYEFVEDFGPNPFDPTQRMLGKGRDELLVHRREQAPDGWRERRELKEYRPGNGGEMQSRWTEYRYRWTEDRILRESRSFAEGGCTYEPAVVEMRLPLRMGARWETTSRCGEDAPERTESGQVVDRETLRVGVESVRAFVIRSKIRQFGKILDGTVWAIPGLTVREEWNVGLDHTRRRTLLAFPDD